MKPLRALLGTWLLFAVPAPLLAQDGTPTRLMRGDISGTVGWVSTNKSEFDSYNDWYSQGEGSLALGWYWTDHHETEVEVGTTSDSSVYASTPIPLIGQPSAFVTSIRRFATRRVAVIQHYQFRRNEWVHPFVGAGLDIVREAESRTDNPVFGYDPVSRQSRQLRDAVQYDDTTEVTTRGVLTAGVKAYFSRKVFSLTDLRVSIGRRGAEDVQWRFGLGVDF